MTQEEKARAYEDALERAKKELQACGSMECDAAKQLFRLFPELKESEDEKIRKELIKYFTKGREYLSLIPYNKEQCVAWLKKQGKQKTWSEEDEEMRKNIEARLHTHPEIGISEFMKSCYWLKSLKDKYAWKPSDEQMKALHDLNLTGNISYVGQGQELINLYNDLKKL